MGETHGIGFLAAVECSTRQDSPWQQDNVLAFPSVAQESCWRSGDLGRGEL